MLPTAWVSQPLADPTFPEPPSPLTEPEVTHLRQGTVLHRVHETSLRAAQFNPGYGKPTRFAPFNDDAGATVPSLYASNALRAAIHETIFHDILETAKFKTVPKNSVHIQTHSELSASRDLRMVELRNVQLNRWGISRRDLISSSPVWFDQTVLWANAIHREFPQVDGLVWTSNQYDPDDAHLFFGDRVSASEFKVIRSRGGHNDTTFIEDVEDECQRRGITLTI